jgi:hypothetical protein
MDQLELLTTTTPTTTEEIVTSSDAPTPPIGQEPVSGESDGPTTLTGEEAPIYPQDIVGQQGGHPQTTVTVPYTPESHNEESLPARLRTTLSDATPAPLPETAELPSRSTQVGSPIPENHDTPSPEPLVSEILQPEAPVPNQLAIGAYLSAPEPPPQVEAQTAPNGTMATLEEILRVWDQAGERPHELLQEMGLYPQLLAALRTQSAGPRRVYRGTVRHAELVVGDTLVYDRPTSWSVARDKAALFIENSTIPTPTSCSPPRTVMLSLRAARVLPNPHNSYGEEEAILPPSVLIVTQRTVLPQYVLLDMAEVGAT